MTRREMLLAIVAVPSVAIFGTAKQKPRQRIVVGALTANGKYGFVDVQKHCVLKNLGVDLRILCNGVDVTQDAFEADDTLGYVNRYKRNAFGQFYVERNHYGLCGSGGWCEQEAAQERLTGHVEFVRI